MKDSFLKNKKSSHVLLEKPLNGDFELNIKASNISSFLGPPDWFPGTHKTQTPWGFP